MWREANKVFTTVWDLISFSSIRPLTSLLMYMNARTSGIQPPMVAQIGSFGVNGLFHHIAYFEKAQRLLLRLAIMRSRRSLITHIWATVLTSSRGTGRCSISRPMTWRSIHIAWSSTSVFARASALLLSSMSPFGTSGKRRHLANNDIPRAVIVSLGGVPGGRKPPRLSLLQMCGPQSKAKPPVLAKKLWVIVHGHLRRSSF